MNRIKTDLLQIVFEPYSLAILNSLTKGPRRFRDLQKLTKNDRTLSSKLTKLKAYGLVEVIPLKHEEKYVTGYKISKKGKALIAKLEKI